MASRHYNLQGEGQSTSVDLEAIYLKGSLHPFGWCSRLFSFSAKTSASFAVRIIVERTVNVFPRPVSSAKTPPPVSTGKRDVLDPSILCL
jgi:hypothetical protein